MTAVVNSLWQQTEGAAADGAAVSGDADSLGRKWPLSALAPRTTWRRHQNIPKHLTRGLTADARRPRERARAQNQRIQLLIPMLGFLTNAPRGSDMWCVFGALARVITKAAGSGFEVDLASCYGGAARFPQIKSSSIIPLKAHFITDSQKTPSCAINSLNDIL